MFIHARKITARGSTPCAKTRRWRTTSATRQEAEAERRKLPPEETKKLSVSDQFAEASRLRETNLKNAIWSYRHAFDTFAADPFKNELKASDVVGYVQAVRTEDGLDQIMWRLWEL